MLKSPKGKESEQQLWPDFLSGYTDRCYANQRYAPKRFIFGAELPKTDLSIHRHNPGGAESSPSVRLASLPETSRCDCWAAPTAPSTLRKVLLRFPEFTTGGSPRVQALSFRGAEGWAGIPTPAGSSFQLPQGSAT